MGKKVILIREVLGVGGGVTPHHEGKLGRPVEEAVVRKEERAQSRGEGWPSRRRQKRPRPPASSPEWGELGW